MKLIMEGWRKFLTEQGPHTQRFPGGLGKTLPSKKDVKLTGPDASEPDAEDIAAQGATCPDCKTFLFVMSILLPELALLRAPAATALAVQTVKLARAERGVAELVKATSRQVGKGAGQSLDDLIRTAASPGKFQQEVTTALREAVKGGKLTPRQRDIVDIANWTSRQLTARGIITGTHRGAEIGLKSAYEMAKSRGYPSVHLVDEAAAFINKMMKLAGL